ncbi:MAG: hypothetical protein AAF387_08575 [Pseudomonadota bacterium]
MLKTVFLTIAIVLLCLGQPGIANAQTISGAGSKTCRAFLQSAELESTAAVDSYVSWAQGFASGFNWANPGGREVRLDHAGLLHWLLQYCTANPLEKFHQAAQAAVTLHAR